MLLFLAGNDLVITQKLLLETKASALAAGGGGGIIGNMHLPMVSIANVITVTSDQFLSLVVSPSPLYLLRASSPQQLLHPPQTHPLPRLLWVPGSPLDCSHLQEVDLRDVGVDLPRQVLQQHQVLSLVPQFVRIRRVLDDVVLAYHLLQNTYVPNLRPSLLYPHGSTFGR